MTIEKKIQKLKLQRNINFQKSLIELGKKKLRELEKELRAK